MFASSFGGAWGRLRRTITRLRREVGGRLRRTGLFSGCAGPDVVPATAGRVEAGYARIRRARPPISPLVCPNSTEVGPALY